MKFYNADLSPNCLRCRAVAAELGLELEIVDVDLFAGDGKKPDYLAINPNGKVPALVDGDFILWESRAINAYLAAMKPEHGLYPDAPKIRAVVDQWSYWQAIHLGPAMQKLAFELLFKKRFGRGEPDEAAIAAGVGETAQFLGVLEKELDGREWVTGDLTLADFALASTFIYREKSGVSLDETPSVAAWIARMEERPSWRKATKPVLAWLKG